MPIMKALNQSNDDTQGLFYLHDPAPEVLNKKEKLSNAVYYIEVPHTALTLVLGAMLCKAYAPTKSKKRGR